MKYIPLATYRLQLNQKFTFHDALQHIAYLDNLGISHCYFSPILMAKQGSQHGYDIVDHQKLNPEIGSINELQQLHDSLKSRGMSILLDIVPNHMLITDPANSWWQDILENGPSSIYANYFDIDWSALRTVFKNKVLLPFLDQQYGNAIESQLLKVVYDGKGAFTLETSSKSYPTDPKSWALILEPLSKEFLKIIANENVGFQELNNILLALNHLPNYTDTDQEKSIRRLREKESIKKRLEKLLSSDATLTSLLVKQLATFNGIKGDPKSFDRLENFLNLQPYRLCDWRVANDEINYRRFFDIIEYAGLRTENEELFQSQHQLIKEFVDKEWIEGLRIDHIDGLWDPELYLQKLREQMPQIHYVIAEKILTGNEKLRSEWQLQGTVGYDFLNQVNGVFIYQPNKNALFSIYEKFTSISDTGSELNFSCKKLMLETSLSSELHMLAKRLLHIASSHRSSQDFTAESLRLALRDVIASFPVYRTYIRISSGTVHELDRQYILAAIVRAKKRNPAINSSIYNFIQSILLFDHPLGSEEELKKARELFVMRFQQITGPVMAKGLEDTAFYRFYPLCSCNEVGGEPHIFGINIETFHKKNVERMEFWPYSMLASTTHDTKRSEDVRARINILSEIPEEWERTIYRWSQYNQKYKTKREDESSPDSNEEYLLYQTLVGTWPLIPMDSQAHALYSQRIQKYMEKAIKEAKVNSSWMNPYLEHDQAVAQFVQHCLQLSEDNLFLRELQLFSSKVAEWGMLNSLSQTMLKLSSPGVPDIYQGNELWAFNLVDPDNRHPVDFSSCQTMLEKILNGEQNLKKCLDSPKDGYLKLWMIQKILNFRKLEKDLFLQGIYLPLKISGNKYNHVIGFARIFEEKIAIILTGRFFSLLAGFDSNFKDCCNPTLWDNTKLELPTELAFHSFKDIFTGSEFKASQQEGVGVLALDQVFHTMPFACLHNLP